MPQPDSSRNWAHDVRYSEVRYNDAERPWPVDPAAPSRFGSRRASQTVPHPKDPKKDGRTPDDKDGNEELEREIEEDPPSHHTSSDRASSERTTADRQAAFNAARREFEHEDTGEWVATERFTLEDELEDTWPTVPARYLE